MKKLIMALTLLTSISSFANEYGSKNNCYQAFLEDSTKDTRYRNETLGGLWSNSVFNDARKAFDKGDPNILSVTIGAAAEVYFFAVVKPFMSVTIVPIEYFSMKAQNKFDKAIAHMINGEENKKTKSVKKSLFNLVNYRTDIIQEDFEVVLEKVLQDPKLCPFERQPSLTKKGMSFIRSYGHESFTAFAFEEADTDLMRALFADPANYETDVERKTLNKEELTELLVSEILS